MWPLRENCPIGLDKYGKYADVGTSLADWTSEREGLMDAKVGNRGGTGDIWRNEDGEFKLPFLL
jgi:hypothetical protein